MKPKHSSDDVFDAVVEEILAYFADGDATGIYVDVSLAQWIAGGVRERLEKAHTCAATEPQ